MAAAFLVRENTENRKIPNPSLTGITSVFSPQIRRKLEFSDIIHYNNSTVGLCAASVVRRSCATVSIPPVPQTPSVAVSNLIQHNGSLFLPLNDEHPRVHFCTPLITMPFAPLQSKGFLFYCCLCVHSHSPHRTGINLFRRKQCPCDH